MKNNVLVDFDVMVNDGRSFYANIISEAPAHTIFVDGETKIYVREDEINDIVKRKCPTLRKGKFQTYINKIKEIKQ